MNTIFRLLLLTTALMTGRAVAQTDDFADGNDTGWTRFAPVGPLGGTSFSFPGGGYRITCQPTPNPGSFGPARGGSLRMDTTYANFCTMVDVIDFNPAEDASVGLLARVQPGPGAGTLSGYAMTYQTADDEIEINKVTSEVPDRVSNSVHVSLVPGQSYRFVFYGIGSRLTARIYNLANLALPLVEETAIDETWTTGTTGVVVFSDTNTATSATFDNFKSWDGKPYGLDMVMKTPAASEFDLDILELSWPVEVGMISHLQESYDMQDWRPMAFGETILSGDRITMSLARQTSAQFFRLKFGPPF